MKRQKINFRKRDGTLEEIESVEWKNNFGARIFLDKREKDGLWHTVEYSSGMEMLKRKTRAEVMESVSQCLEMPGNVDVFHSQIKDAVKEYGYANQ
jgi:hypothetical protein